MGTFSEHECDACERCGAFIPKVLVKYHQCRGSDKTKRPVNVTQDIWFTKTQAQPFDKIFDTFKRNFEEDPTYPRIKIVEIPTREYNYLYAALGFIAGGLVVFFAFLFSQYY